MASHMHIAEDLKVKVETFFAEKPASLADTLGVVWLSLAKDRLVASMPVSPQNKQPFGILHGGASVALAETLASVGGWLNIDEQNFNAVGLEINANHIRPAARGSVLGTATPIHLGRSTHVWQIEIRNEEAKLVCLSRCTLAIVPKQSV